MMTVDTGIEVMIKLHNFISTNLYKTDLIIEVSESNLVIRQDGTSILVPDYLTEIMIIPKDFKIGYVKSKDIISLFERLKDILGKDGKVPEKYVNSYVSPSKFGFSIWSRYPYNTPGVNLVATFSLKVHKFRWWTRFIK